MEMRLSSTGICAKPLKMAHLKLPWIRREAGKDTRGSIYAVRCQLIKPTD